jgi:transcriptional regulator with XRE-family HTH domain
MSIRGRKRAKQEAYERLLAQERLIFEVTEEISRVLTEEELSRAQLAERLGRSKGFVTQLLSGERNMTLRTVADLVHVLGRRFSVRALAADAPVVGPPANRRLAHRAAAEHRYRSLERCEPQRTSRAVRFYGGGVYVDSLEKPGAEPDSGQGSGSPADHEFTFAS